MSRTDGARWLATGATLTAIVFTLVRLASALAQIVDHGLRPTTLYYLLLSLGAVLAAALSLAAIRVAWSAPGTGYLSLFLSLFALAAAYEGVVPDLLGRLPLGPTASLRLEALGINALVVAATASGLRWLQHYPTPLTPTQVQEWALNSGPVTGWASRPLRVCLSGSTIWIVYGVLPFIAMSMPLVGVPLDPVTVWILSLVAAIANAILHQTVLRSMSADALHVRRATWALEALIAGGTVLLLAALLEVRVHLFEAEGRPVLWLHAVMLPLAIIAFLGSAALSVFIRGALDPSLVIGRTAILGAVGLALTVVFLVGEEIVSGLVASWFGLPELVGGVIAGLLAAAMFGPLFRWAKRLL